MPMIAGHGGGVIRNPGKVGAAMLAAACCAPVAAAQSWPAKPIRIVVPYAAGGPIDAMTRPLAQKLNETLGQAVVIDNRGGANGVIGVEIVAKAPADGYTLVVGSLGSFGAGPVVLNNLPYDVIRDFAPVSLYFTVAELLVVHPALPAHSVAELVALAKSRPNQLNFASSGSGAPPQLAVELLKQAAQLDMVHVAYKGMGPAVVDLIAGSLHLSFADLPLFLPHVNAGKLRPLAVGVGRRAAVLPDVPTMAEAGFPQVEAYNWYALFAPSATPRDVLARLNTAVVGIVNRPDMRAFYQAQGGEATAGPPGELAALLRSELAKWGKVVKMAGIKAD